MEDSPTHAGFVHLRVHTAYSLSEGAIRIPQLIDMCRDYAMPAVAITDTDNLFGGLEFSAACAGGGVQPIIGCQVKLQRQRKGDARPGHVVADATDNLVLLVKDEEGYGNLLKLLGQAYLGHADEDDGPLEPHVTLDDLKSHAAGLIALSGGPEGPVGNLLVNGQDDDAEKLTQTLSDIFPGCFYIEIMRHGLDAEKRTEAKFIDLAYTFDLPLVATNEAFFTSPDMYEAHDALLCIAAGAYVSQAERRRLSRQHYFKSAEEMQALFADLPEAIDNTLVIARRCATMIDTIDPILPPYDCGEGRGEPDELKAQSEAGLELRLEVAVYTPDMTDEEKAAAAKPYRERLEYELGVITDMGFPGYFLIVADFIHWSKERGIPVGPGRGSGAGSVVAWALTITDLDPLRWGLLFERFLNPERVSMPDFDIDFCQDRRDEVIRYVQDKYGRDRVAQIITFGKLQARAVLRDVGRVLEMPYGQVDRICKLVPNNPADPVTLQQAIESEKQFREEIDADETVGKLVETGLKLEGLYRHASTHAAGVVIGDRPLDELIPLYRDPRSDMPVTGFNMKFVEKAGLVKFDFLGLKTLTVLDKAVKLVADHGVEVDLATIPLDDKKTFKMLARGETIGVFQLESVGMRDVLTRLKADTFEDIIAVVALYRPGPMENIPSYIARKHGQEDPDYLYPTLEGILKETFGIMIYQEQVMQIAQELSGFTLGNADLLRRAMGKKDQAEMDRQRHTFVDGAKAKGVPEGQASMIFDQVNKFAGYGFNKSHAAAYALVAYQTAWFKANYPVEFMAASMTLDLGNTDKLNLFRQELGRLKIPLLGPDINASGAEFRVEEATDGAGVRYALAAIKNVGEAAMAALVAEREENGAFADVGNFTDRVDSRVVNKRQLENLVRAGAFDQINSNRRQLFNGIETILRHASAAANDRDSNQIGLFGGEEAPMPQITLPETADYSPTERMREEFDAVGFYLSGHPLDAYGKSLEKIKARPSAEIIREGHPGPVNLAGTVISKRERTSGKGNRYAFVQLSDASGIYEIIVFSDVLANCRDLLEPGSSLFIKGNVKFEGEQPSFSANGIEALDAVASRAAPGLLVSLSSEQPIEALSKVLKDANGGRGRGEVLVVVNLEDGREVEIDLQGGFAITPEIRHQVQSIPGIGDVREI
ncbi:MAG: DNA polymerase III subunit alpha [Rhodospirillaceae bacterium]|nr:DNA polymerase III subunit alpha [Rhodospirillaceae bacterium]MBT7355050.1 DNA polymerase III subunit alpha [Rhodospirillaceae bacterium]